MDKRKQRFLKSAKRLHIENLTKQELSDIWQLFADIPEGYVPDNFCYCFTDYALNILSKRYNVQQISSITKAARDVTLADVIYSLCIQDVTEQIAVKLANTWIKRCHKIYIRIDEELKDIPKHLWQWIFDDREQLYQRLLSLRICFIGKGEELFSRVNNKNKSVI